MTRFGRYLWGAFVCSALYFAIDRLLWPGDRTLAGAIAHAVLWGVITQALIARRELRKSEGKETEYPPLFYFGFALLFLVPGVVCWVDFPPHPSTGEWFTLFLFPAMFLLFVYCGVTAVRRNGGRWMTFSSAAK